MTAPRSRWPKFLLWAVAVLCLGAGAFFGWTALETYVFAQRIPLLTSEKSLSVGMTQQEVENLFGMKPEDRRPPDPNRAAQFPPPKHEGVIRYAEMKDGADNVVNYTGWYHGLIVTSQHHVVVTYDANDRVKKWDRGPAN